MRWKSIIPFTWASSRKTHHLYLEMTYKKTTIVNDTQQLLFKWNNALYAMNF